MEQAHKNKHISRIWKAVQKDDRKAFDEFYRYFIHPLYNYGHKLTPNTVLIEDCLQELFIQLWKNRANIHFQQNPKHYLFLSFRRLVLKKISQNHRSEELKHQFNRQTTTDKTPGKLHQDHQKRQVNGALQHLPKRQKEALFLKYYENMDYEEIAAIMAIQKAAVYKLVSKGIQKLKSMLTIFF